ncbi:hypothetical protein DL766_004545 [Monosporascus sp. MC13-8B]|uniref:Transcription factor domain-containing protein n=1 Tax=Monosporascus cannonballus TaxID=155416 RepID=A0ABY0HIZ2_9PEZI|nr:hypothetical protein DL763_005733 [Monosporascus cannonballus]RYO94163.1 hypothetical protein DL762_000673 [Monosporascus cannonballus]RYP31115.1 hypothetical protein DL766_004545 [Monosporascus sp. MC13-8B]
MQFSHYQPAVRHSLISISSLYEQVRYDSQSEPLLKGNKFALLHYNTAIRELKALDSEPLVLLVCILFICIEFLQGNRQAAFQHCKHGILILKNVETAYPWVREYLAPMFRRLNMVPLFFGMDVGTFPRVTELDDSFPNHFISIAHAQFYLDDIMNRTIRLARYSDMRTVEGRSPERDPVPREYLAEQRSLKWALDGWDLRFQELTSKSPPSPDLAKMYYHLVLRYLVTHVWVSTAFQNNETVYDEHIEKFRFAIDESARLDASVGMSLASSRDQPKFSFEIGFLPLLYFIVMKCRCLATRIRALALMRSLGVARENFWESSSLWLTGRRIIELEHGITLAENGEPCDSAVDWTALPPDRLRIRTISTDPKTRIRTYENGEVVPGMLAGFFMRNTDGKIYVHSEFLPRVAGARPIADSGRLPIMSTSIKPHGE